MSATGNPYSRHVDDVLASGYLTPDEKQAMEFEYALEANEETMAEGAAIAVTAEQFGIEPHEYAEILISLPDGEWWKAEHLPVKDEEPQS